jgi:hypothetical protein
MEFWKRWRKPRPSDAEEPVRPIDRRDEDVPSGSAEDIARTVVRHRVWWPPSHDTDWWPR